MFPQEVLSYSDTAKRNQSIKLSVLWYNDNSNENTFLLFVITFPRVRILVDEESGFLNIQDFLANELNPLTKTTL